MRNRHLFRSLAVLVPALLFANIASAATQNITAKASGGSFTTGNAISTSPSVVTCTKASGGQDGSSACAISAPGWNGLLRVGESIGTAGPGNVTLTCQGVYAASGGSLSCAAKIDDQICSPEQTISASASSSGSTLGLAPVKSAAIVECKQASGGQNGTSGCWIQSPGWNGLLLAGQSIATSGAGTVSLSCNGIYSANGGRLSCTSQVSQFCP